MDRTKLRDTRITKDINRAISKFGYIAIIEAFAERSTPPYSDLTMEAQVSSEQSCSAEADTTAVVWKQRLDFLDEEDITSQYNDQMEETLGSNASQERSTLELDEELKKMMSNLERLSVVNLAKKKDKIADLFQEIQQVVQYLEQQDPHNDT